MAGRLQGKVALVTGGASGIGRACAERLARDGAIVVVTDLQDDKGAETVEAIRKAGGEASYLHHDVTSEQAWIDVIADVAKTRGRLDILVNNAGIARQGMVAEMSLADIDALLNVNVRAAVLVAQAAIPHLTNGGRIVFIGSCLADRITAPGVTVYSMTKSAQIALTHGLARELGPRDITVNLVQPGATDTDMNPANGDHAEILRSQTPLGRYGKPEDVAAAVAFLASPAARQISGATLTVDGGLNA